MSSSITERSSSRQASSRGNKTFVGLDLSNQSPQKQKPQKQKRERKLRFADFKNAGQDDGKGDDGEWNKKNPPTSWNKKKKDVEKKDTAVKTADDDCK